MNIYLVKAFKKLGKSQPEIIKDLKKSQPYVSALMNGKKTVGKDVAKQLSNLYGFDIGSILTGEGKMLKGEEKKPDEASLISVNYLKVPKVPIYAQAGFLSGYGDSEYWEELPTEIWEVDRQYRGNYVVFEVQGDSMDDNSVHAILDGDRILCREIQKHHWMNKLHIKQWNFVIVHKEEGIIVKRITKHNIEKGIITCHSLNSYYEDFDININDVVALYNVVDLKRNLRL